MKILMILPHAPYPPTSGGRMRLWEQIRYLGQRHTLSLVYRGFERQEHDNRSALEGYCERVLIVEPPRQPVPLEIWKQLELPPPVHQYYTPAMETTLKTLQPADHDLIILETIYLAHCADLLPGVCVLSEQNIESGIRRQWAQLEKRSNSREWAHRNAMRMLLADYENKTWPRFPLRITVSQNDKREMDRRCSVGRTVVVENGIDFHSFRPVNNQGARKILFMGAMDYFPNVDAVDYFFTAMWPALRSRDPSLAFVIAGRDPGAEIRALASQPGVEVIPNPADMSEVAEQCCLAVVPLRVGGGTRLKILHAQAMGLPVVSTSRGCEGLPVTDGRDILIRDDPKEFADAVLALIADAALRGRLRQAGRTLIEQRYDWNPILQGLETELLALAATSCN